MHLATENKKYLFQVHNVLLRKYSKFHRLPHLMAGQIDYQSDEKSSLYH